MDVPAFIVLIVLPSLLILLHIVKWWQDSGDGRQ